MKWFLVNVCLFCFLPVWTIGSALVIPDISFRRISPLGGFTYGAINTIGEDSNGFIWFGTIHGLYRYNTVEIQKFTHDPADSTTIPGNSIRTIFNDPTGNLWIGTASGLSVYDIRKDQFVTKRLQDDKGQILGDNIYEIIQGEGRTLYILSNTMLGKLDLVTNHFEAAYTELSRAENFVSAANDANGNIWIGGSSGTLWLFNSHTNQTQKICKLREDAIRKILVDSSGVWVGYNMSGLDYIAFDGKVVRHYGNNPDDVYRIHHNRVRDIYRDDSGRIWVATYKGISIIDKGLISNILPHEVSGIPYSSIYKIFRDSKNGIWIGTWSGGLAYQSSFDNRFVHSERERSNNELDDEFISSFTEKRDGTLLIGTEFGNLNRLDRTTNKMINVPIMTNTGKKIENIKSLLLDENTETLWIGTFLNGLWYQRGPEATLNHFAPFKDSRVSVYSLAKSDSGIWIGTFGKGLAHFNHSTGRFISYNSQADDTTSLSSNNIRTILLSKSKSLWIGTNNGLNQFDPATGKFKRFNQKLNSKLSGRRDEVLCLQEDRNGDIWMGTSGRGVSVYNPKTQIFRSLQIKDGLNGDDVYGIVEDKNGIIWISTENGICNFNPDKNAFRSFDRATELLGNQFNPGSQFLTKSGEVLFGDAKGFMLITPDKLRENPVPPKALITNLSINNKPVDIHGKETPLHESIITVESLKLAYHQNSLTFNFVANNFLLPEKNRFKYRLKNYDNTWIQAGTQNYATFTKIPPGDYTLEVLVSNNDNIWSTIPTQIRIVISPPFWRSWYAWLIYLSLVSIAFYFLRKEVKERERYKKELLMERLLHESDAQLQQMKLRFFTNISHEFRTPLTLIVSPINLLLEKYKLEAVVKEYLQTIQRNSNRLLRLINQLIDVSKIESGKAVFQPSVCDLNVLCREVIQCFEMEARDKNIRISFVTEAKNMWIQLDSDKAEKILFNVLSNAMKFTSDNGLIQITVTSHVSEYQLTTGRIFGEPIQGDRISVEIADNGQGIEEEDLEFIFERFGQGKQHLNSGTGIGLHMAYEYTKMHGGNIQLHSKPGFGSSFTISFPATEEVLMLQNINDGGFSPKRITENHTTQNPEETPTIKEIANTLLIIEDNFELRNYLKNILKNYHHVITAPNGKQGLETALTIIPDLVITDVMMPLMDGFEVCRQLKENILSSHIPVILLTALSDSEKKIGGFSSGADAYITKPFDENVLVAQVANLIRSRDKLREIFATSGKEWARGMEFLNSDLLLIEKAEAIVEQHLHDKAFVVEQLARELGLSPSSLFRKLNVLTNQSPTEFIRFVRLKKAMKLMQDGNCVFEEIGFAVGFNSHSYFTSSFKKQFGMTPSEYLNDLKFRMEKGS